MSTHKLHLFCWTASVAAVCAVGPASAQSSISRDKVEALEAQINALQQELRDLKGKVNKAEQAAQKAYAATPPPAAKLPPPPAAPTAVAKMTPSYRPSICAIEGIPEMWTKTGVPYIDNLNCIALTSRLHLDVGGYDYRPNTRPDLAAVPLSSAPPFTVPQNLDSGINARRARIGVIGTFMADWVYSLVYDMGGSSDGFGSSITGCVFSGSGTPAPSGNCRIGLLTGGIASGIHTAYLSYQGFKGVAIEGGYSPTMYTIDQATSSNELMFMERASPQVIASNIAAGTRSNFGGRAYGDWYWAGAYVTGPTSGAMHSATGSVRAGTVGTLSQPLSNLTPPDGTTEQLGGYARAAVHFGDPKQYSIHLGGDVAELFKPPFDWVTGAQTLSLTDRPELRIDPTQIIGTNIQGPAPSGKFTFIGFTNAVQNVSHARVYSVEAAGNLGPLFVQGEYFWIDVDRRPFAQPASSTITGPTLHFNGGYIEASWALTGETRTYNAAGAAYNAIVPANPFSWKAGAWGAWEIAGRYSVIDLNDRLGFPDGASGGRQTIYAAGLNWYVNRDIRFMLNYLHGVIDKQNTPTDFRDTGAKFDAVAMRTQIYF
jgi:phosphate-selective porin OprO/OprP